MRTLILLICLAGLAGCTLRQELAGGEMQRVAVRGTVADCGFRKLDVDACQVRAYAELWGLWGDADSVDSVDLKIFNGSSREIEIDLATARVALVARGGKRYIVQPEAGRVIEPDRVAWITTGGASVRPTDVVGIIIVCPEIEIALVDNAQLVARNRELCSRTPPAWWKCRLSAD